MITLGVDAGSHYVKMCILEGKYILAMNAQPVNPDLQTAVKLCRSSCLRQSGLHGWQIKRCAITGHSSPLVRLRGIRLNESHCLAAAAIRLNPATRTIVDAGSMFIKTLEIDGQGQIRHSAESDRCAAGCGKFLAMMAHSLETGLDSFSELAARSTDPYTFNTTCSVFAESEAISQINAGRPRADIAAGILISIITKIKTILGRTGQQQEIVITGGVARIDTFVENLQAVLGISLLPIDSQIVTAYGAALLAGR